MLGIAKIFFYIFAIFFVGAELVNFVHRLRASFDEDG
jgi:uncharacterized membrane protein YtjA (UPF0391 family)